MGVPGPGVVNHGVGDDLGAGRKFLVVVLVTSPDLDIWLGRDGLLLLLPLRPEEGGQGGEGGSPARSDRDGGEVSGGLGGGPGPLSDLGHTHSTAGHCQGLLARPTLAGLTQGWGLSSLRLQRQHKEKTDFLFS